MPSISEIFQAQGVPEAIWKPILSIESGGNPLARALTPYEDSIGLFQLNRLGGLGSGYTVEQLANPTTNATIAAKAMAPAYKVGVAKGLEGLELLRYTAYSSGWPTMQGVGALAYDPVVQDYDTRLIKAAAETAGSGSTRTWGPETAEIVSSDSKIAKIFFIVLGGGLVLLGVKVLTDVPLVITGEG